MKHLRLALIIGLGLGALNSLSRGDEKPVDPKMNDAQAVHRYLGRGYKSLTDEITGANAVDAPAEVVPAREEHNVWRVRYVDSRETLRQVMSLSAGASLLGTGSFSGGFYKSVSVDATHVNLYIEVTSKQFVLSSAPYQLSDRLSSDLKSAADLNSIYTTYGDSFIGEVVMGGKYLVVLQYDATSREEREQIESDAKAAVGNFTGSGEFKKAIVRISKRKAENSVQEVYGASGGKPSLSQIYLYASNFPKKVRTDRVMFPVDVTAFALDQANGFDINSKRVSVIKASRAMKDLQDLDVVAEELRSRWQDVVNYPYHYVDEQLPVARESVAKLSEIQARITEKAREIGDSPVQDQFELGISIDDKYRALPTRVPSFNPTLRASMVTVKRDPASGSGVGSRQQKVVISDPDNIDKNWLQARQGSHTNVRKIGIKFEQPPPFLDLQYRAVYQGKTTDWKSDGDYLEAADGVSLMGGIEFRLVGEMADAYWLEYQVHVMELGDSPIYGNTQRSEGRSDGMAMKSGKLVEGIRLAIWPKK